MEKYISFGWFIFIAFTSLSQYVIPVETCLLPSIVGESSGLELDSEGLFWTHNDSGGDHAIYGFNASGELLRTIHIENANNEDWEDMAQSSDGTFFIGDFGNNNNNRSSFNGNPLRIYCIPSPSSFSENSIPAQIIEFEYEDRNFFAPSNNHEFDVEAMFWWNDTLHLFNKNRTNPTTGYIKHYVLPAQPGNYLAKLVDSLDNGGKRITAADISPCGSYVALLARDEMYLLSCFEGNRYLSSGQVHSITFANTQKEAVVFDTPESLFITDERNGQTGGRLYFLNLNPLQVSACNSFFWDLTEETYVESGIYTANMNHTNDCTHEIQLNVQIQLINTEVEITNNQVLVAFETDANYQWINCANNSSIAGATSQSFSPSENGSYAVRITKNGCTITSECIGISNLQVIQTEMGMVKFFPNPVTDELVVTAGDAVIECYSIFDIHGNLCLQGVFNLYDERIDVSSLSKGIYFLELEPLHLQMHKFMKQ
jgi:hypothetical protein